MRAESRVMLDSLEPIVLLVSSAHASSLSSRYLLLCSYWVACLLLYGRCDIADLTFHTLATNIIMIFLTKIDIRMDKQLHAKLT